ncbi:nuclear transport factor 2 family protein [Actinomadura harenae]|uniref:Nuclear transport factor 2 family protein n=2 Tax=Actinomadura harenae TaxID=2483351 RepID=A0A3M2M7X0_9ACTN|nr:nuclear transport factor 2 family protein [Actinomadura harenae]
MVRRASRPTLYEEVQQFYARQMRLLDEHAVAEWAETFTPDGVFATQVDTTPAKGRHAIEAAAGEAASRRAAEGVRDRHWLGMLDVEEQPDGTITARSYALVVRTPLGGRSAIQASCTCSDVLVRAGGRLQVRTRYVTRDDLSAGQGN